MYEVAGKRTGIY